MNVYVYTFFLQANHVGLSPLLDIHLLQCQMVLLHPLRGKAIHLCKKQGSCKEESCWYDAHMGFDAELCQGSYRIWVKLGEGMHYKEDDCLTSIAETHEEGSYAQYNAIITTLLLNYHVVHHIGHRRAHESPEASEPQAPEGHGDDEGQLALDKGKGNGEDCHKEGTDDEHQLVILQKLGNLGPENDGD